MDLARPNCFHSSSSGESHSKRNPNPFEEAFPDPICKLNLKGTSEFVKAYPIAAVGDSRGGFISAAERRKRENSIILARRSLDEGPSTPGRPVFRFRKSTSSKWDDAEKWLVNNCSNDFPAHRGNPPESAKTKQMVDFAEKSNSREQKSLKIVSLGQYNSGKGLNGVSASSTDFLLKDKLTDEGEPVLPNLRNMEPSIEEFLFENTTSQTMKDAGTEAPHKAKHKDVSTEMTPLGSSTTSRCHTPIMTSSPPRHNTPANRSGLLASENSNSNIDITHLAKLQLGTEYNCVSSNWSSREEEEEEVSKSLRHFETGNTLLRSSSLSRAAAWEEEEKTKCCLRYQREEERIQAWVNLQCAKAEAESKKLEVKIQKMRSNFEEKLMKKMTIVHKKAEEWRAEALEQHTEQIQRAGVQAQKIKRPSSLIPSHGLCACFPCNNSF